MSCDFIRLLFSRPSTSVSNNIPTSEYNAFINRYNIKAGSLDITRDTAIMIEINNILQGNIRMFYSQSYLNNMAGLYFYYEKHDYHSAATYFYAAYKQNSGSGCYNMGIYHLNLLEYDRAISYFKKAIDLKVYHSYMVLGVIYTEIKKYNLAKQCFFAATKRNIDNSHYSYAKLATTKCLYTKEAIEDFFLRAMIDGKSDAFNGIIKYYGNKQWKLITFLKSVDIPNQNITNYIEKLEMKTHLKVRDIKDSSIEEECCICKESFPIEKILAVKCCSALYCSKCHDRINKCSQCRKTFMTK